MSNQNSQPKRIDVLELSDSEKAQFMNAAREVLRQSIEDAKSWRAIVANNQITRDGESTTL